MLESAGPRSPKNVYPIRLTFETSPGVLMFDEEKDMVAKILPAENRIMMFEQEIKALLENKRDLEQQIAHMSIMHTDEQDSGMRIKQQVDDIYTSLDALKEHYEASQQNSKMFSAMPEVSFLANEQVASSPFCIAKKRENDEITNIRNELLKNQKHVEKLREERDEAISLCEVFNTKLKKAKSEVKQRDARIRVLQKHLDSIHKQLGDSNDIESKQIDLLLKENSILRKGLNACDAINSTEIVPSEADTYLSSSLFELAKSKGLLDTNEAPFVIEPSPDVEQIERITHLEQQLTQLEEQIPHQNRPANANFSVKTGDIWNNSICIEEE